MRPRKQTIRESFEELDELRRFYNGTVEQLKLMFLRLLKEDPQRPLSEAARRAGITERRGRYWWETYCNSGLRGLLERRVWGRKQLEKSVPNAGNVRPTQKEGQRLGGAFQIDYPAFINGVAGLMNVRSPLEWGAAFRDLFIEHFPEVDHAVVSIRPTVNTTDLEKKVGEHRSVFRRHAEESGKITREDLLSSEGTAHNYLNLIRVGKQNNFDFDRYHFPPAGFDIFAHPGKRDRKRTGPSDTGTLCIASMLLFRKKTLPPFSHETLDLIERLRPYLTYVFSDIIIRTQQVNAGGSSFTETTARISKEAGLSEREHNVLLLLFLGYTEKRVASALNISTKTVESHINAIYRKTRVSKITELFAKYQTPMGYTRKQPENEE